MSVQTTLNNTQGNDLSPEMKTYYDMELIDVASPNLVHDQFGQKRPIPTHGGRVIEFRKFSTLPKATAPLVEGVTPSGKSLNVDSVSAEVAQYGDYITMSDMLELSAVDNVILEATKKLGAQAGATLDTIVRNELAGGTQVIYAPKIENGAETEVNSRADLDESAHLTADLVFKAATQLKAMNAPKINGDYICIIHPHVAYDIMRSNEWIDVHKYANPDAIYNGEIGKLGGVRFVETTEAIVWKGEGCPADLAVYGCIFLGADAYGSTEISGGGLCNIIKQKGSAGSADPLDQRSSVGWKATKAAKRLVEEYIVRVECCSSYSRTANAN